jgi:hypothetical protein
LIDSDRQGIALCVPALGRVGGIFYTKDFGSQFSLMACFCTSSERSLKLALTLDALRGDLSDLET